MRTYARVVYNASESVYVCTGLIESSQWFEFLPLPHGLYEIKVKEENRGMLDQYARDATIDNIEK